MDSKSIPLGTEIQQNELLTVKEVADFLRVGRVTVWRWCKAGTIPACRVGRNWRIPRADFLDMLATSQPFSLVPPYCKTCETILAGDGHSRLPVGAADPDETVK